MQPPQHKRFNPVGECRKQPSLEDGGAAALKALVFPPNGLRGCLPHLQTQKSPGGQGPCSPLPVSLLEGRPRPVRTRGPVGCGDSEGPRGVAADGPVVRASGSGWPSIGFLTGCVWEGSWVEPGLLAGDPGQVPREAGAEETQSPSFGAGMLLMWGRGGRALTAGVEILRAGQHKEQEWSSLVSALRKVSRRQGARCQPERNLPHLSVSVPLPWWGPPPVQPVAPQL